MSLLHGTAALFLAQVDHIIEVGWQLARALIISIFFLESAVDANVPVVAGGDRDGLIVYIVIGGLEERACIIILGISGVLTM